MKRGYTHSSPVINILLKAFDRLGEMLDSSSQSNEIDILEHMTALKKAVAESNPDAEKESAETKVVLSHPNNKASFSISKLDLREARDEGKNVYILSCDLISDVEAKGKTPISLMRELQESGSVIDAKITVDTDEENDATDLLVTAVPIYILYSTVVEEDLLKMVVDLEEKNIFKITFEEETEARDPAPDIKAGKKGVNPPSSENDAGEKERPTATKEIQNSRVTDSPAPKTTQDKPHGVSQSSQKVQSTFIPEKLTSPDKKPEQCPAEEVCEKKTVQPDLYPEEEKPANNFDKKSTLSLHENSYFKTL